MHAALVTGKHRIEHREFPAPEPDARRVVVDIAFCGICGTDLHAYQTGEPYNPAICGHEWSGHVSAVRPNARWREGDRVGIGVATACGACATCRRGDPVHCESVFAGMVGVGPNAARHGGFAPRIAIDATRLYPLRAAIEPADAALLEPLTVAVHAVRRTAIRLGDKVVVIGAGPIGLLVLQCALAAGAARVAIVEPRAQRRLLAEQLGAITVTESDAALEALGGSEPTAGADVVFECAGLAETINLAATLTRRGGKVSLVGLPVEPSTISGADWLVREVELVASLGYQHDEFEIAQDLVTTGRIDLTALRTATVALSDIESTFHRLAADNDEVKVLVDPSR